MQSIRANTKAKCAKRLCPSRQSGGDSCFARRLLRRVLRLLCHAPSCVGLTHVFEQLRSRDQATEDPMKIDKLIPGTLNAVSNLTSSSSLGSPGPANPTPNPPPGGGGGGGGGGGKGNGQGKGKGKGANKRNSDGFPKADGPPSSPPGQQPLLTPGTFASNYSWSAQVLTIKRENTDIKTGKLRTLPSGVFDVGKFCGANIIAFKDYCWEFVCSYPGTGCQLLIVSTRSFTI